MNRLVMLLALAAVAVALPATVEIYRVPSRQSAPPPPPPPNVYNNEYSHQVREPPVRSQDCVYGNWTRWSDCTVNCEEKGFVFRTRPVLEEGSGYGRPCDQSSLQEWKECMGQPCVRDCQMTEWDQWSDCSASCDEGSRFRLRSIISPASNGGAACGALEEFESCNKGPCPRDCSMEHWSAWSDCTAQCGPGRRARVRSIATTAAYGGQECGATEEWEKCNEKECAQDCVMAAWSGYSECTADCGGGSRARYRDVLTPALNGGLACGPSEEWESCNEQPCPRDCVLGQWTIWTTCPACGPATRSRSRSILEQGVYGGLQCDLNSLSHTESCNLSPCPVDCVMHDWSAWTSCSEDCGEGRRSRHRLIQTAAMHGGQACGPSEEWEKCNSGPCPVDCVMNEWDDWSPCSAECGEGHRSRQRSIKIQAAHGGQLCGPAEEWESCESVPCAQDCEMSPWSKWSECGSDCDGGSRSRHRLVTKSAMYGGVACGPEEEWESCPCLKPSICRGYPGIHFIAEGCTAEFIMCRNGEEHHKLCPEPSFFDRVSSKCRLAEDVLACSSQYPSRPARVY